MPLSLSLTPLCTFTHTHTHSPTADLGPPSSPCAEETLLFLPIKAILSSTCFIAQPLLWLNLGPIILTFNYPTVNLLFFFHPHLRTCLLIWREGKGGRERGREKHWCEREASIGCLSYVPWLGTDPATQARALIGIELATFQFTGRCSNQLSHTCQG